MRIKCNIHQKINTNRGWFRPAPQNKIAMQIINEKEFSIVFGMGTAKVYVEESKTNYYVSIQPHKYAMAVVGGEKVSKKQAKDMRAAIDVVYKEYESKNAGWKWVQK